MSVTKTRTYSPGPWKIDGQFVYDELDNVIATITTAPEALTDNVDPDCNACLMGSALQMYQAIETAIHGGGIESLREVYQAMQEQPDDVDDEEAVA